MDSEVYVVLLWGDRFVFLIVYCWNMHDIVIVGGRKHEKGKRNK